MLYLIDGAFSLGLPVISGKVGFSHDKPSPMDTKNSMPTAGALTGARFQSSVRYYHRAAAEITQPMEVQPRQHHHGRAPLLKILGFGVAAAAVAGVVVALFVEMSV